MHRHHVGALELAIGGSSSSAAIATSIRVSVPCLRLRLGLQALLESWFRCLRERVIWRNEFETIDQARAAIGADAGHDHERAHLGIDDRMAKEVRQTWVDAREAFEGLQKRAA